jgi:hypothetical protein
MSQTLPVVPLLLTKKYMRQCQIARGGGKGFLNVEIGGQTLSNKSTAVVVQSSGSKHTSKNTLNVKGDTSVIGSTTIRDKH